MVKNRNFKATKTQKKRKQNGGKTFANNQNVKLSYNDSEITCEICKSNNYNETIGAFDKSKVRSGIGQLVFGEAAEILDTTSVIIYTCNTCGLCKVIRNKDPIVIKTTDIK